MAQLSKVVLSLLARNTDRTIAGTVNETDYANAQVEVLRVGCRVSSGAPINPAASGDITVPHPGRLKVNDIVKVLHSDGTTDSNSLTVDAIDATGETVSVTNGGGSQQTFLATDRLVLTGVAAHRVSYTTADFGVAGSSDPIALTDSGTIEFYVNESKVDLLVTGTNLTTKYITDVTTDPMRAVVIQLGASAAEMESLIGFAGLNGLNVEFLAGSYTLSAAVTLPGYPSMRIYGAGSGVTVLTCNGDYAGFVIGDNNNDLTIEGMTIKNVGAPTTTTSCGIYDGSTSGALLRTRLRDVEINGFYHGVRFGDYADRAWLSELYVHDCVHTGIWPGDRAIVENCRSISNGTTNQHHGLYVDDGWNDVQIIGGEYSENGGSGIHVVADTSSIDGIQIHNVRCVGNGAGSGGTVAAGILLQASGAATLSNFQINGAYCKDTVGSTTANRPGIWIDNCDYGTVDTLCEGNAGDGLRIEDSSHVMIRGTYHSNGDTDTNGKGVWVGGNNTHIDVDAVVYNNADDGIRVEQTNTDCRVAGVGYENGTFNHDSDGTDDAGQLYVDGTRIAVDGFVASSGGGLDKARDGIVFGSNASECSLGTYTSYGHRGLNVRIAATNTQRIYASRMVIDGWWVDDVGGTVAATEMARNTGAGFGAEWVAPRAGAVIGVLVKINDPRTAGTLTVEVYKNGSGLGLTAVLDGSNTTYKYTGQNRVDDQFVAGDELTVYYTTSGFTPAASAEITASIEVEM